jgi:tetratricopeptide (TPR) repeat protein
MTSESLQHGATVPAGTLSAAIRLHQAGRLGEAEAVYRQLLDRDPGDADALHLLGVLAYQGENHGLAVRLIGAAIGRNPSVPSYYNNLGIALLAKGEVEEAETACLSALRLNPRFPEAWNTLGNVFNAWGRPADAIPCFDEALRLQPDFTEALGSLGVAFQFLGYLGEAVQCQEGVLQLRPGDPEARYHRSIIHLLRGEFEQGLPGYEERLRIPRVAKKAGAYLLGKPEWDGSLFEGKTLLVECEQGFGDTLQFARFLPRVKERGGEVLFHVQPELHRLLEGVAGPDRLLKKEPGAAPGAPFELYIHLLSLPRVFGTTSRTLPEGVSYLKAAPEVCGRWRTRLGPGGPMKAGLVWAGNPRHPNDRHRSCRLAQFAPLARVPGLAFFGLQKGTGAGEALKPPQGMRFIDLAPELHDFVDTAAALETLDLVITVDSAVAHLAGGLGRPAWVLLPFMPDWRWMLQRGDSPWYPSVRLFRQPAPGDWASVFEEVAVALGRFEPEEPSAGGVR